MATIATSTTGIERSAAKRRRTDSAQCAAGFTVLELTVVIAIALLLTGIAVPLIGARLPGAQFDAAVRQVAAHARLARNLAVARNVPVRLIVDVGTRRYSLSTQPGDHGLPSSLGVSLYAPETERIDAQVGAIRFYGDGSSSGGRITLTDGIRKRGVDVQWLTGRVSIVD